MTVDLETERLRLRPNIAADFEALHALTADPAMRTFLSGEVSREDSFGRLLKNVGSWALFGYGNFAVLERASGAYIGNCGVFRLHRDLDPPFEDAPEAGWVIAADRWGCGYAGEAMTAILDWFEAAFGPQRIVCMIMPGNAASERIAARLGFHPTGLAMHKGEEVMRYARVPRGGG